MADGGIPSSGTPSPAPAPATPRAPETPAVVTAAPVLSAPPQDKNTPLQTLAGRIVADQPPVEGEVRVRTPAGDIVVRSDRPLPDGAEVVIDLNRQKTALLATIRLAVRAQDVPPPAPSTPSAAPPPAPVPAPPVLPGDRLVALILSGSIDTAAVTPASTAAAVPLDAKALQAYVRNMLTADAAVTAAFRNNAAALPQGMLQAFADSPDPAAFLQTLKPAERAVFDLLKPQMPQAAAPMPQSPPPAAEALPTSDGSLLTILRAMTAARLTQQSLQPLAPQPPSSGSLLSLIQNVLPALQGRGEAPAPAPATPLFTQAPAGASLRIVSVTPPLSGPAAAPPPAPSPPLMLGEVIGQTSGGMAVIRAPSADFVLNAQVQLPVGSKIVFEPTPLSFGELAAKLSPEGLAAKALSFDPLASRWWPSLSDALDILAQHAPAAARAVAASLPSPGPQMVPGTLFFLAALRAGIVESWLGAQTMQVLRDHGGRPLAERISADFGNIARQSGDALPGEWRAVSLPLMHDAQLSQIQLITRRHADEDDKQGGGHKTTRFIVNLSLSRLGDMQLDGLMREPRLPAPGQAKNLDIVIRSGAAFDESLRQELKSAYARGLQETAMTGSLQFQPDRQGWVTVAPAASDREQLA